MKRLTTILLLLLFAFTLNAQEANNSSKSWKNQIGIGVGVLTPQGFNDFGDVFDHSEFDGIYPVGDIEIKNGSSSGTFIPAINFGYKYYIKDFFSIGIRGFYNKFKHNSEIRLTDPTTSNTSPYFSADWESTYVGGLIEFKGYYGKGEIVTMYSGASIGVMNHTLKITKVEDQTYNYLKNKSDNKVLVAYHIVAWGIRVGKQFGGFTELAYGNYGIVNIGAFVRFKSFIYPRIYPHITIPAPPFSV